MLPAVGRTSPSSARPNVDLPDPDSPTMPRTSPGASSKFTPSTARTLPDELPTSRATALVRNAKSTCRSLTWINGSGFVGNGHLLAHERRAVVLSEVGREQPALGLLRAELHQRREA